VLASLVQALHRPEGFASDEALRHTFSSGSTSTAPWSPRLATSCRLIRRRRSNPSPGMPF
jgi:hypothetical protein